ncbi:hypothetical protein BDV96DRAFT_694219 [Lophiotrema nucula]|uniref:Uncharacterized protein n=1 Tax=Lophiotrema nucula TaxID=690887 RepID=A0A6A5YHF9_9PLEO|nr:hypothetical protein BDV96DRAFT_694219 [Lophiotrema nucula]
MVTRVLLEGVGLLEMGGGVGLEVGLGCVGDGFDDGAGVCLEELDGFGGEGLEVGTGGVGLDDGAGGVGLDDGAGGVGLDEGAGGVGFEDADGGVGLEEGSGGSLVEFKDGMLNDGTGGVKGGLEEGRGSPVELKDGTLNDGTGGVKGGLEDGTGGSLVELIDGMLHDGRETVGLGGTAGIVKVNAGGILVLLSPTVTGGFGPGGSRVRLLEMLPLGFGMLIEGSGNEMVGSGGGVGRPVESGIEGRTADEVTFKVGKGAGTEGRTSELDRPTDGGSDDLIGGSGTDRDGIPGAEMLSDGIGIEGRGTDRDGTAGADTFTVISGPQVDELLDFDIGDEGCTTVALMLGTGMTDGFGIPDEGAIVGKGTGVKLVGHAIGVVGLGTVTVTRGGPVGRPPPNESPTEMDGATEGFGIPEGNTQLLF